MKKKYDPNSFEQHHYERWEKNKYFKPNGQGDPFCIVIPPPNVTGTLHMGHAFQDTIMDTLTRYHRMMGFNSLWQPGMDHAGIATQMVVERLLNSEGTSRLDISREKFVDRVWNWKEESGGIIAKQLRRMGASLDWDRDCFTMDEQLSDAVSEVFIRLYEEGLIYRGKRLVNWDPKLHTALSDLEVLTTEEEVKLWHLSYPIKNEKKFLIVATTRPETMFGDTAVAVNPNDDRYKAIIGKKVIVPVINREIPIIADEYVDCDFGTGCVKITPAHDFNDYEIGKKHRLEMINIFNENAQLNENVPKDFQGLTREKGRECLLKTLSDLGFLKKTENHLSKIPRGDRSGVIVEPFLTNQWYVDIAPLAKPAIDAVKNKEIKFIPENWSKTYFDWMENIQDWCISRQLWWGHRIPAWYDNDNNIYVGKNEEIIRKKYKIDNKVNLKQDEDVLDTWFSSALWPFSTQGWPDKTESLKAFYPGQVLVTGFDIIFFWVARMIMMGIKFTGKVPFKEVYIHGLIRDQNGQKMSKSKGNVLDPIDLIDGTSINELLDKRTSGLMQDHLKPEIEKNTKKEFPNGIDAFGADSLRFTFASLATTGRDIRFDMGRIEGYKNFCNKLWNAAHYVIANSDENKVITKTDKITYNSIDLWIETELNQTIKKVHQNLKDYRLDLASQNLYEFIWHQFCDWYIEFSKAVLKDNSFDDKKKQATRNSLLLTLETILRLVHPIMPFITEEIWLDIRKKLDHESDTIMLRPYPLYDKKKTHKNETSEIEWIKLFILGIRQIRGEMNISPGLNLDIIVKNSSKKEKEIIKKNINLIKTTGKICSINYLEKGKEEPFSSTAMLGEIKILVPLENHVNVNDEIKRLNKQEANLSKEIYISESKLKNKGFLDNAPAQVVEKENSRVLEKQQLIQEIQKQISKLKNTKN